MSRLENFRKDGRGDIKTMDNDKNKNKKIYLMSNPIYEKFPSLLVPN